MLCTRSQEIQRRSLGIWKRNENFSATVGKGFMQVGLHKALSCHPLLPTPSVDFIFHQFFGTKKQLVFVSQWPTPFSYQIIKEELLMY